MRTWILEYSVHTCRGPRSTDILKKVKPRLSPKYPQLTSNNKMDHKKMWKFCPVLHCDLYVVEDWDSVH